MIDKSMEKVAVYIEANGWKIKRHSRKGNLVLSKEGCKQVTVSPRSSDHRAQENVLSLLKREDRALAQKDVQQNS